MSKAWGMADFKSRIRPLFRRTSSSSTRSTSSTTPTTSAPPHGPFKSRSKTSLVTQAKGVGRISEPLPEEIAGDLHRDSSADDDSPVMPRPLTSARSRPHGDASPTAARTTQPPRVNTQVETSTADPENPTSPPPIVTLQRSTQDGNMMTVPVGDGEEEEEPSPTAVTTPQATKPEAPSGESAARSTSASPQTPMVHSVRSEGRKQSVAMQTQEPFLQQLLAGGDSDDSGAAGHPYSNVAAGHGPRSSSARYSSPAGPLRRKIWVKRPGAPPTLVTIQDDDLVDDAKDVILHRYGNSLGRSFDSPDVTLHLHSRAVPAQPHPAPRVLGPEESLARVLDDAFPGGQAVSEALTIEVPVRRTPRHSPMPYPYHAGHGPYHYVPHQIHPADDARPPENGGGYFPAMPAAGGHPSPRLAVGPAGGAPAPHAMSVLSTGQVPPIPSPRAPSAWPGQTLPPGVRPRAGRNNTSSPTSITANGMTGQSFCSPFPGATEDARNAD